VTSPASDVWWRFLARKIETSRSEIPGELAGIVAIEAGSARYHIIVDGPRTEAHAGEVEEADAIVETTEAELETILYGSERPLGAIRVRGRAELFIELLKSLKRARSRSLVEVRGGKR
jgi:hypothetical protein